MLRSLPSQTVVVPLREWSSCIALPEGRRPDGGRQVLRECVWCFSFTVPMHRCWNLTVLAQWVRQKGTRARTLKQRRSHYQFHMQALHGASEVYFLLVQETHFRRGCCRHPRSLGCGCKDGMLASCLSFIVRRSMESARKSSRRRAARASPASWFQRCCGIGGVGDRGIELCKGRACLLSITVAVPRRSTVFLRNTCTQVQAYSRKLAVAQFGLPTTTRALHFIIDYG